MALIVNIIAILIYALMIAGIFFLRKKGILQDNSAASIKPYSFSRVQIVWWTIIIVGSFLYIFACNQNNAINSSMNIFNSTSIILLGISAGTLGVGRIIDTSQVNDVNVDRHQDISSEGFFIDILSDENGISIHRCQSLIFNLIYGLIFIYLSLVTKKMPDFGELELTLIGISSATYIGLKATENKTTNQTLG
jgi:hypothetical protein